MTRFDHEELRRIVLDMISEHKAQAKKHGVDRKDVIGKDAFFIEQEADKDFISQWGDEHGNLPEWS